MCNEDTAGVIECTKCAGIGEISKSLLLNSAVINCSTCKGAGKINCPEYEEDAVEPVD
jgi:DnaJ-class molecular chaperone